MHLLLRVEQYLRRSGTPATRFGREAARDPRLVFDMRKGRTLRAATARRVTEHLAEVEQQIGDRRCRR